MESPLIDEDAAAADGGGDNSAIPPINEYKIYLICSVISHSDACINESIGALKNKAEWE